MLSVCAETPGTPPTEEDGAHDEKAFLRNEPNRPETDVNARPYGTYIDGTRPQTGHPAAADRATTRPGSPSGMAQDAPEDVRQEPGHQCCLSRLVETHHWPPEPGAADASSGHGVVYPSRESRRILHFQCRSAAAALRRQVPVRAGVSTAGRSVWAARLA